MKHLFAIALLLLCGCREKTKIDDHINLSGTYTNPVMIRWNGVSVGKVLSCKPVHDWVTHSNEEQGQKNQWFEENSFKVEVPNDVLAPNVISCTLRVCKFCGKTVSSVSHSLERDTKP